MRLFISIDISEKLKHEVLRLQKQLLPIKTIKLVPKENLHLTIKFLGEVSNPELIITKLNKIKFKKFKIISNNIGFFPNKDKIRVVWIGFKNSKELSNLHSKIETVLKSDFKNDFEFKPHLTIARIKFLEKEDKQHINSFNLVNSVEKTNQKVIKSDISTNISSFKLMKSTLTPKGPVYECIKEFKAKEF